MDRWKSRGAKSQTGAESEGRKVRREKIRRKKMQVCEKVGKSQNTVFFRCFVAPEGRKVGSLKRRARRHLGKMRNEKLHAVAARSRFWSEKAQNTWASEHFWKLRCQESARRCGPKHISKWKCTKHLSVGPLLEVEMSKSTPLWREAHFQVKMHKTHHSDHFWKLRCRKSARRCGAKHISKSKCTKHTILGPLLEVAMSKKCTPLWREAHFEVKMYKTPHVRTTFGGSDVEKVHAVVARSTFRSQNVKNTRVLDRFWRFRCRFASLHYITLHYTTFHYTSLHYTTLHYNYEYTTTLHYTPLH